MSSLSHKEFRMRGTLLRAKTEGRLFNPHDDEDVSCVVVCEQPAQIRIEETDDDCGWKECSACRFSSCIDCALYDAYVHTGLFADVVPSVLAVMCRVVYRHDAVRNQRQETTFEVPIVLKM